MKQNSATPSHDKRKELGNLVKSIFIGLIIAVPLLAFITIFFVQDSGINEVVIANVTHENMSVVAIVHPESAFLAGDPLPIMGGDTVPACEDDSIDVCYSDLKTTDRFIYANINNLQPDTAYEVGWATTFESKIFRTNLMLASGTTTSLNEKLPELERVYGRIVDRNEDTVPGALVMLSTNEEMEAGEFGKLATITNDEGAYSMSYDKSKATENFLQNVEVISPAGEAINYRTASFWNQPVADIVVGDEGDTMSIATKAGSETIASDFASDLTEGIASGLIGKVEAANTCVTGTQHAGIRAQCNDKIHWAEQLDTKSCPSNENRFKVGLIKHTSSTQYHKPATVTLKLQDRATGEFLKDPSTDQDLVLRNGAYIYYEQLGIEYGTEYVIKAFDGTTECTNNGSTPPTVKVSKPTGTASSSSSGSGNSGSGSSGSGNSGTSGGNYSEPVQRPDSSGYIPAATTSANMCKKIGENFAIPYEVDGGTLSKASGLGMRWGEALISDMSGMQAYANTVVSANQVGMTMLLRICYKGNCQIQNGSEYGNGIVQVYETLKSAGQLPQNGLYVHVGHNEPNNAEYIDPNQEAAFVHDTMKVLQNSGYLSQNGDDVGIKAISPNLDLYISADGQWPGCSDCDDPNPHPNYTAQTYVSKMMEHSGFREVVGSLYAWAVNDYILDRGPDSVPSDVSNFVGSLPGGATNRIMVTELGRINTSYGWDTMANTIAALESMENVEAILLFNSLGTNPDGSFAYHSDLHNNNDLIKQMIANCTIGSFQVPQEGSVGARVELSGTPRASGSSFNTGSVAVSGYSAGSGTPGSYGSTMNGQDPCIGKSCTGSQFRVFGVAEAGIMNRNFEEGFEQQGRSELETPKYWHPWYEHQCHGTCGIFECKSGPESCRAPEFKPTEGNGGTIAKHFATYSTQHAGIFQRIHLGHGGENILEFRIKGGAFTEITPQEREEGMLMIHNTKGRIGIDPTGGIDPFSANIVWSDWQDMPLGVAMSQPVSFSIETTSRSEFITVFTAGNNQYPYRTVDVYWDDAELYLKNDGVTLPAIGQGEYTGTDIPADGGGAVATPADFECTGNEQTGPSGSATCWSSPSAACLDGDCAEEELLASSERELVEVEVQNEETVLGASDSAKANMSSEAVLGASDNVMTIEIPAKSEYQLSSTNFEFTDSTIANFDNDTKSIPLYQDINENGKHDSNEPYIPKGLSNVEIEKVGGVAQLELKPGINLLSVPLYTEDFDTAAKIIDQIAAEGGYATSVGTFRNYGANPGWNVYNQRGDQSYSDDFAFVPNDAVYIVVQDGATIQFRGSSYTEPVDTYLKPGWNLIALKGTSSQYNIQTLLATINEDTGISARTAAIWSGERGRYETFVLEVDGDTYGFNFVVPDDVGIFIFVDSGSSYWSPS